MNEKHDILAYDFEAKFENYNEFNGSKIKLIANSKAYELIGDYNSKILKFKKIVHLALKSEDDEMSFVIEKNSKIVASCKFYSD